MRRKIILFVFALLVVFSGIIYWYISRPYAIHSHAAFLVFRDNKLLNFSGAKFMEEETCPLPGQKDPHDTEKIDLHDNIDDVIHVHRSDAQWLHLLAHIKIVTDEQVTFYLNGQKTNNLLNLRIHQDDRALILVGNNTEINKKLSQVPSVMYIRKIGSQSETCK